MDTIRGCQGLIMWRMSPRISPRIWAADFAADFTVESVADSAADFFSANSSHQTHETIHRQIHRGFHCGFHRRFRPADFADRSPLPSSSLPGLLFQVSVAKCCFWVFCFEIGGVGWFGGFVGSMLLSKISHMRFGRRGLGGDLGKRSLAKETLQTATWQWRPIRCCHRARNIAAGTIATIAAQLLWAMGVATWGRGEGSRRACAQVAFTSLQPAFVGGVEQRTKFDA